MHILLIDDSSSTRSLLRTLINAAQGARHEISEASSAEEALQKIGSGEIGKPELVIVDINMGGMSGYDLCREMRKLPESTETKPYIIIVTANEGVEVINEGLEAGANDYMPKPVNVKILHVRLRVAERLLTQANISASGRIIAEPKEEEKKEKVEEAEGGEASLVASAIEATEAPIAIVQAGVGDSSFEIIYSNAAMTSTTEFEQGELVGKSLADLEAWTPEFLKMAMGFIGRGAVLSHVPLWSKVRQDVPIYLSFCPIRGQDNEIAHYLVIHHL
jgi:DNA-binding response OmpR family regulator